MVLRRNVISSRCVPFEGAYDHERRTEGAPKNRAVPDGVNTDDTAILSSAHDTVSLALPTDIPPAAVIVQEKTHVAACVVNDITARQQPNRTGTKRIGHFARRVDTRARNGEFSATSKASSEKEKQTFLRSKNVYGELDAMPRAW